MTPHPIPDAALESDIAILGRKGSGKSYCARGLVERLLTAGRRVVVLDPMGSWAGLKARTDGQPGFPVVVIGGLHADLALDPEAGAALGAFLAQTAMSCVIDVSELRRPDMARFCADLLRALYETNRESLWLVLEEADYFCPQGATREQAPLAYEIDQIARRGRARGFRLWSITQRPAKIVKDVLSQAAALVLMKLIAPQDKRAVEDWIGSTTTAAGAEEVVASLPGLPTGEGWLWAPDIGVTGMLERMRFPRNATLDTSFTPAADGVRLAQPNLAGIRRALALSAPPLSPEAIRAEAFAQGRAAGAQEERERLRGILGAALESLQDAPEAAPAPTVAADPPKPAPGAPAGPRSNDEAQRAILGGLNKPQRELVERVLERGTMTPDRLGNFTNMLGAQKAFRANLDALVSMGVLAFDGGLISASDRLYPFGKDHR